MRRSGEKTRALTRLRPKAEGLEIRLVPAAIDLANVATTPFGVQNLGAGTNTATGYRLTDAGDVNGDGFDDYLIGAPSASTNGTQVALGNNAGAAYLVFGSRQVGQAAISDFLNLNTTQRSGDLAQLGNANQTNPFTGATGFNFDGLQITASRSPNGQLGAAVASAGDVNGDGLADFLIGAPNGADSSGLVQGFGRAYLVYGSAGIGNVKLLDLDTPSSNPAALVTSFVTTQQNSRLGSAMTGAGNFLRDGSNAIALGAPNATPGGLSNSGAVYVVSGTVIRTPATRTIDVGTIGQAGGVAGVLFGGEFAGAQAGTSLSSAGDVNGDNGGANGTPDDLLIGGPSRVTYTNPEGTASGPGNAYLIYGAAGLQGAQSPSNNVLSINLNRVGLGGSTNVLGADFMGTTNGQDVGFAVSSAGDFNGDGVSDILVGSPGSNASAGRVYLIYGASGAAAPTGNLMIDALPGSVTAATFNGAQAGALAGYSVTATGLINNDTLNEIAIGSPGLNNNSGAVYLVPGNPSLIGGPFSLDTNSVQTGAVSALVITDSQASLVPNFLGGGLGARKFPITGGRYIDGDTIADFVIGAPGFSPTGANQRQLAGTAFALQGAYLAGLLPIPTGNAIAVPIGVNGPTAPFSVNLNNGTITLYVGSNATVSPTFQPVTMINASTIVVNGVAFPNATVTADGDFNNDGITDAIVTISPTSALSLSPGTRTITVRGQTNEATVRIFTGSASVSVTGNPTPVDPVFPSASSDFLPFAAAFKVPTYGESLVPAEITLGKLRYKPLPVAVATRQFKLSPAYANRLRRFYGLGGNSRRNGNGNANTPNGANTLGDDVFKRGKFPVGQVRFARVNHKVRTIPAS